MIQSKTPAERKEENKRLIRAFFFLVLPFALLTQIIRQLGYISLTVSFIILIAGELLLLWLFSRPSKKRRGLNGKESSGPCPAPPGNQRVQVQDLRAASSKG